MRYLSLFFILSLLAGCDSIADRNETILSTERKEISCTYQAPGICMDCGLAFDGSFSCGPKPKPFCDYPGKQEALIQTVKVAVVYESGKRGSWVDDRVKKTYSSCR